MYFDSLCSHNGYGSISCLVTVRITSAVGWDEWSGSHRVWRLKGASPRSLSISMFQRILDLKKKKSKSQIELQKVLITIQDNGITTLR